MKSSKNITDMTVGSPWKLLISFTMPLLVGNIFQQFYNLVDTIVVGNYVGADALAAVGTCGSLSYLFFALCSGLSVGVGILAAQYFGANEEEMIYATVANSTYLLAISGAVASLVGYLFAPQLLELLQVPESIMPLSVTYLRVTSCGIVFIALYNGVAALLRALGDSKSPLYFLILSCILNLVLDLVFVLKFQWGVFGVALATIIAQFVSCLVSVIYAWKTNPFFRLTGSQWKPRKKIIVRCMVLGVPVALQNALINVSTVVLQGVVNGFGETVMAAYTVVGKVEQLVHMPYNALATALTSYAGQNKGAGEIDRVRQGYKISARIVLGLSAVMIPIFFLLGRQIAGCFVEEGDVISISAKALRIDSLFYYVLGMIYVPRSVLNGCGDAQFGLINGAAEVVVRILCALVLTKISAIGYWGIWLTQGMTWTATALVCIHRYVKGKWAKLSLDCEKT